VRLSGLDPLFEQLAAGRLDMAAATKSRLFVEAGKLPGSRVLEGSLLVEPIGMGVPTGRAPAAAAYVSRFVEDAKARGPVAGAIDRAGLVGVSVPEAPRR
jgi:polar amino acid transport system substrate-binding protein